MKKLFLFVALFMAGANVAQAIDNPILSAIIRQRLRDRILLGPAVKPEIGQPRGVSWYVTDDGTGTGTGTSLANSMSCEALSATGIAPGDTVYFSGVIDDSVFLPSDGDTMARITYDFSAATLNTANPRINMYTRSYINIFGGTFGPASSGNIIWDNDWAYHTDVTISGGTFDGGAGGIAYVVNVFQLYNVVIENNNYVNFATAVAVSRHTENVVVRNNTFISSINTTSQTDVLRIATSYNVIIEGNKMVLRAPGHVTLADRHNDVIQTWGAFGEDAACPCTPMRNVVVRYNWVEITDDAAGDGSETWIQMSQYDSDPGIKFYGNVDVGNSVGANGGHSVAYQLTAAAVFYLYNNTVIRYPYPGYTYRFDGAPSGVTVGLHSRNNVTWTNTPAANTFNALTAAESSNWNNNFTFNSLDCFANWSGALGSCTTDPMFQNVASRQFWPAAGSPLIGAGDNTIGAEYNKCIVPGATWPNPTLQTRTGAWDVGAYCATGAVAGDPAPPGRGRPLALR